MHLTLRLNGFRANTPRVSTMATIFTTIRLHRRNVRADYDLCTRDIRAEVATETPDAPSLPRGAISAAETSVFRQC